jgi:hypothetical protein
MKSISAVAVLLNEPSAISTFRLASATIVTKSYANGSNRSSGFGTGLLERAIVMSPRQRKSPTEAGLFPISRSDRLAAIGRQVFLANVRSSATPIKLAVHSSGWREDEITTRPDVGGLGQHCN